jgi:hypothetical protein
MITSLKAAAAIVKFKLYEMAISVHYDCRLRVGQANKEIHSDVTDEQLFGRMVAQMFGDTVRLSSSLLDKWDTDTDFRLKTNNNIFESADPVFKNGFCTNFLLNALHLTSRNPRHTSHVVCIFLSLGTELGGAKTLDGFRVYPISSISLTSEDLVSDEPGQLHQEDQDKLTTNEEIDNEGILSYSIPVILETFSPKKRAIDYTIVSTKLVKKVWPAHKQQKCDNAAIAAFEELKKIEFLQVESPDLNQ